MADIVQIARKVKEDANVVFLSGWLDTDTFVMADTELQTMVLNSRANWAEGT